MAGETATECQDLRCLNKDEKDCLRRERHHLSINIRLVPELWSDLGETWVTEPTEKKIKLDRIEYEQVGDLLDCLAKRTLRDFNVFRDALVATCQRHVVESCLAVSSSSSDTVRKSIWKEHLVVLEDMIQPTDALLNATTARLIIDRSQKEAILGTTGPKEKIQKMLNFLAINGVTDLTLHEALSDADQHDVVDFLIGTCALMTTVRKDSLKRKVLAEAISLDEQMIQYLIERCILNESEKDIIQCEQKYPSEHGRVRCLLDIIGKCSHSAYDVFVQALSSTGQREAVNILKPGQVTTIGTLGPFESHQKELGKYLSDILKPTMNELKSQTFAELRMIVGTADRTKFERRGLREYSFTEEKTESIEQSQLFSKHKQDKAPRSVLVLGPPGAGKTHLCFHLADLATNKKMHEPCTIPFIIPLRELENEQITMKDFLLTRCCSACPQYKEDEVWKAIEKNEDKLWFIIDGYDEYDIMNNPATVTSTTASAKPEVLLNSLIKRKVFESSRVMITSRPYNLEKVWNEVDRKVELHGLKEEGLWDLLSEQSDEVEQNAKAFLEQNIDTLSLCCSSPLFAMSFIQFVSFKKTDILTMTKSELCIHLVVSRLLAKKQMTSVETVLKESASLLQNLGSLCLDSFTKFSQQTRILYTKEDLNECNISVNSLPTGLISVYNRITRSMHGEEVDKYYHLLHLNFQETLAAVKLALGDINNISKLARDNRGKLDVIFICLTALLGNEQCRPFLRGISGSVEADSEYDEKCRKVMTTLMGSPRRVLDGGDWFLLEALHESKQKCLTGEVVRVMGRRWLSPYSSESLLAADQLLRQDPGKDKNDPLVRVQVGGIRSVKYCPRATALTQRGEVTTAADIEENAQHLHNIVSVNFFNEAGITRETVAGVAEQLSRLDKLEAVSMYSNTEVSSSYDESSALGCLSLIPSLHYLSLTGCDLTSADVSAITSSCECLLHLDIGWNHGVRGGDVESRQLTGLSVAECELNGDELVELVARNAKTLKFLNATDYIHSNTVLSSSHINDILTRCPRLVEMYVSHGGGGELVRALSERRAVCLKHLWLGCCDFSSSSSSSNQVNPSELSDVLTRHSSISSLTLYECHFTSEFMRLLSSSMASVTSLYISPYPPHPRPPRSSDVASLVRASPSLTQLWLDHVCSEWHASDYIAVVRAVNASPAPLSVLGLDVWQLSVDDVRVVVRELTRRLTRLWLAVDYKKRKEMAEVVMEERELGVVHLVYGGLGLGMSQLVDGLLVLYDTYLRESGSFYQHLPPSLPEDFRPPFFF